MEFETKSQKAIVIKFPLNHWQKFGKGFWFKTYQVKIIFRVSWCNFDISDLNFLFKICFICSILYAELSIYFYSVCVTYTFFFINTCTLIFHWNLVKYDFSSIKFRKCCIGKSFIRSYPLKHVWEKRKQKLFINVI